VKQILPELGTMKKATNENAKRMLGWAPRSNEESVVATAECLARLWFLKDRIATRPGVGSRHDRSAFMYRTLDGG
jgi:hypothetical protein